MRHNKRFQAVAIICFSEISKINQKEGEEERGVRRRDGKREKERERKREVLGRVDEVK